MFSYAVFLMLAAAESNVSPFNVADRSQLFVDEVIVRETRNVAFTLHPASVEVVAQASCLPGLAGHAVKRCATFCRQDACATTSTDLAFRRDEVILTRGF